MLAWWEFTQRYPEQTKNCRTVVKLMFDCSRIKSSQFRQNECKGPYCEKCDQHAVEDVEHIMFYCPANSKDRGLLWERLRSVCPRSMYEDIVNMHICDRTVFLLGGLGNAYVEEWAEIYSVIVDYICKVYMDHTSNS